MAASLGDASLNHSTAAGAINAAAYCAYQHLPLPLLLVIEDNGIGDQRADPARLGPGRHPVRAGLRLLPGGRV